MEKHIRVPTVLIPIFLVATLFFGAALLGPPAAIGQDVKGKIEAGGGKAPKVEFQLGDVDKKSETVVTEVKEVTRTEGISTIWLAFGALGALLILVLAIFAARSGGGTTIVREKA